MDPVRVEQLSASVWWERSAFSCDPVDPSCWYRHLVIAVDGDGGEVLLDVMVSDEGGPVVDVLTTEHTVEDMRRLSEVFPALVRALEAVPVTRDRGEGRS